MSSSFYAKVNNFRTQRPWALWWAGNAINDVAAQKINNNNFKANVFVSLANEPGMGVGSFLAVATSSILKNTMVVYGIGILFVLIAIIWGFKRKKVLFPIVFALIGIGISAYLMFCYYPINDNFKFKQFASENHNSVGLPTYRWALENQFKTWQVENEYFTSTDEMKNYFEKVKSTYGTSLGFSNTLLGNTYFILKDNPTELAKVADYLKTNDAVAYENFEIFRANKALEKEPKEAEKLINEVLKLNPQSTESYHLLSKIKVAEKNKIVADSLINKALDLASTQKERQWKINELIETKNEVSAMQ